MVSVAIVCLILFFASYIFSKENIFSPATLVSGIWLITSCATIYFCGVGYPISSKFTTGILLWIVPFCLSALSIQSLKVGTYFKNLTPSKTARDIYFIISLLTLPILIYHVYLVATRFAGTNIFSALRDANVRGNEELGIESTSSFFVVFWLVSYILELMCFSKKNIWRILVLLAMNLFYAIASMGKTNLLTLFVVTAVILIFKRKISIGKLAIGVAVLFVCFMALQKVRSTTSQGYYTKLERFITLYMVSGIPSFDQHVAPKSSEHWGENTFRFHYAVANKLGLSETKPVRPILKFNITKINNEKYETNVYTVLYPFYKDFGNTGIWIFAIITGLIFGWLFKMAQQGDTFALCLYALYATCLIVEFMGDSFYTVFSQNLQYLIVGICPFLITKYHLFEKKKSYAS